MEKSKRNLVKLMYIPYEKIGLTLKLFFPKHSKEIWDYFYNKKIEQNCSYIERNSKKVLKKLRKEFGKRPIRVAFSCDEPAKWKCQSLFNLMKDSAFFHPFIIATKNDASLTTTSPMTGENVKKTYKFFKDKGLETYLGYDIIKNKFLDFSIYKPDIIFYQEPWNNRTSQGPVVTSKFALSYYVPYFIANVASDMEYGLRFHQYLHKHYILNKIIYNFYAPKMSNKGKNLKIVGHTQLDYFYLNKNQNKEKKYIIYAPHWSLDHPREGYATFDWNGKFLLEYAKKHPEINWLFKPHPALKRRLVTQKRLTQKEVDNYWDEWNKIGIKYENGDYMELFAESYGMITDCGSFLTEFLMTEQPVIHLVSDTSAGYNPGTEKIVKSYYQAHNLQELEDYLEDIVINRNDPRKSERLAVIDELGLKDNYCAKNIIEDIIGELNA